jgi:hypothetical protein
MEAIDPCIEFGKNESYIYCNKFIEITTQGNTDDTGAVKLSRLVDSIFKEFKGVF